MLCDFRGASVYHWWLFFTEAEWEQSCVLYQWVLWAKSRCCPQWFLSQRGLELGDTHSRAGVPKLTIPLTPSQSFRFLSLQAFITQKLLSEHIWLIVLWLTITHEGIVISGPVRRGTGTQKGIPRYTIGSHLLKINHINNITTCLMGTHSRHSKIMKNWSLKKVPNMVQISDGGLSKLVTARVPNIVLLCCSLLYPHRGA